MPSLVFVLFMTLFFAAGFAMIGFGLRSVFRANQAKNWPTAKGTIESCRIEESSDSDGGTSYKVEVRYLYAVRGRSYEGTRIAFGYSGSSGRAAHQEIADRLNASETVLVRYDPLQPANAVLAYGLNRSILLLLVFGVTWLLFTTGFSLLVFMTSLRDTGILNTLVTTP